MQKGGVAMDDKILEILAFCVCIAAGAVFCFFGNRWLKAILAIYGFIAGFLTAHAVLSAVTSLAGLELILCSAGVGLIVALLLVFLLYLGIFLIGFGGGVLLSLLITDVLSLDIMEWYVYIPVLIVGMVLGSLTLNLRRIFISIFTSFMGASLLAVSIYKIINWDKLNILELFKERQTLHDVYASTVYLAALAALFFIGVAVQLTITSRKDNRIN